MACPSSFLGSQYVLSLIPKIHDLGIQSLARTPCVSFDEVGFQNEVWDDCADCFFSLRHHEKSAANLGSWPLEDRPTHSRSESLPTNWTRLHSSNDVHRYHLRKGPEVRLCVGELCLANDLMFFHLCSLVELSYGGYLQGMWIQSLYWFTANEWILRHKPCTFGSHRQTVVNMINDGVNQSFVK